MTLVYVAGAWLLGVAAGAATGGVWWPGVAAIATAGVAAGALERRPQLVLIGLIAAGCFAAGAVRYDGERPDGSPGDIAVHNDAGAVRLRGLVSDEPAIRGRTQQVRVEARERFDGADWQPERGGVLVRAPLFPRYRYGDLIELQGELETPPSFPDFDYRDYLARQGIVSIAQYPEVRTIATGEGERALEVLHSVRRRLGGALEQALPEPQAALAQGIFLGQRTSIPQDLTDDMNATGTSHLIAISGHNVSLVAALVIGSLAWLIGRRQAAVVALVAIGAYTALTGASPTVVRAAIMGGLFVVATLVGRPGSAGTSIALAGALMTGWDPLVIEDVSFQLSFAAIAGLVYLAPPLQSRAADALRRRGIETVGGAAGSLLEVNAVTLGAIAATLPLVALHFGRVSAVAPLPNMLLVPAFAYLLFASAATAVAGMIWGPLGEAAGYVAWALLTYMIEVVRFFADLPLASFTIDGFDVEHAAVAYIALGGFAWWLQRRPRPEPPDDAARPRLMPLRVRRAWVLAGGLAVACAVAWQGALGGGSGRLAVTVLDVGQGDAILIETPAGHTVLVDGGANGRALIEELSGELPLWDRSIDLVALTHPQEDHLAGLIDVLERYDVRQVLATPLEGGTATYRAWREAIAQQEVAYREARPGELVELGEGALLRVLGPGEDALASGEPNDASAVLRLEWREVSFLLTGDIEAAGEEALLRSGAEVRASVLMVAHHGSRTSTTPAFVRAVQPSVAVVSVGEDNRFGHPAREVLERLAGALVLRTDEHGTVRLETDGERLWVEAEGW